MTGLHDKEHPSKQTIRAFHVLHCFGGHPLGPLKKSSQFHWCLLADEGTHQNPGAVCKEPYKKGLLWAGRGTIPVNELA